MKKKAVGKRKTSMNKNRIKTKTTLLIFFKCSELRHTLRPLLLLQNSSETATNVKLPTCKALIWDLIPKTKLKIKSDIKKKKHAKS